MNLNVNVIYIRGTVGALGRFIPLLVQHTPWRFRLVANGCTPAEVDLLHWYARADPRLRVHDLATDDVLPLGKALCALLADTPPAEPFAFMDSDIAVTGDLAAEFEPLLRRHAAVFSGTPVWAIPTDQVLTGSHAEVAGPHTRTAQGLPLGGSYFGIYHRDALDRVMKACGVRPDKYIHADLHELTQAFREFLDGCGLIYESYVPPKLLNLGYAHLGIPIAYQESTQLLHIGGYSMATYQRLTSTPADLQDPGQDATARPQHAAEILDYAEDRPHMSRKVAVCERLTAAFAALNTGQPLPVADPFADPAVEARVRRVESTYAGLVAAQHDRPPA